MRHLIVAVVLMLSACASAPPAPSVDPAAKLAEYEAVVARARAKAEDIMSRARGPAMTLLAADLAFSDDAQSRGLAVAFSERYLEDGLLIGAGAPIAVGPAAVAKSYEGTRFKLVWAPMEAVVDGDVGVTWGVAALSFTDDRGALQARSTRYVTVWKRQPDGGRKIWIDTGTSGPLPDVK
jgi:ketosteroid isomerase-like protein